jgi:MFS family permease
VSVEPPAQRVRPRETMFPTGFRPLWLAHSISEIGSQITLVALPVTAAVVFGATPVQMGILTAAGLVPYPVLAMPAGVWVDRLDRRRVMIWSDVARLVLLGTIPLAAAAHVLSLTQLYVVALLAGAFTVLFDIARTSFLPAFVPAHALVPANMRMGLSTSVAGVAGPGLGGMLVPLLTAPIAIAVDAVSFGFSALLLGRVKGGSPATGAPVRRRDGLLREVAEGLRYVMHHPVLRTSALAIGVANFFGFVTVSVTIIYATRTLGIAVGLLGWLIAAGGVGAVIGSLLAHPLARRFGLGKASVVGLAMFALGPSLLPLATGSDRQSLVLFAGGQFIIGAGIAILDINVLSLRQAITPDRLQGRTGASIRMVQWGTKSLGALAGGVLGAEIGLRSTLWVAVGGGLIGVLWMALSPVPAARIPGGPLTGSGSVGG